MNILVCGAGTMGHGIALLAGKAGNHVYIYDNDKTALCRGMDLLASQLKWFDEENELESPIEDILESIEPVQDLDKVAPSSDLIIEAITEDQTLKSELYHKISPLLSAKSIVASNTSYLDPFSLAPAEMLPRLAAAHFYVPPYLVPLVEVVGGDKTDPDVVPRLVEVFKSMGQAPVVMKKFIPGFIVNRIQRAIARETFNLVENDIADPEEIDKALKASLGVRLPVTGVFLKYDLTGLDLVMKIHQNPSIHLTNEDKIPRMLRDRVEAGDYGIKTGKGFYDYGGRSQEEVTRGLNRRLLAYKRLMEC